jgi:hypothetical protein
VTTTRGLTPKLRKQLKEAVESVGSFRAAEQFSSLSDRCLRKAANDPSATFRPATIRDIETTIAIIQGEIPATPSESKLDRIERKLDLIIKHLGI